MSESNLSRKRAGGRKRLLTRDQVIEAAIEIGLEDFSMKRVADELGVGIATLYQYVDNRDDLLRLIVMRTAVRTVPRDVGQHWSEFLREYVATTHDAIASHPHVVIQFMEAVISFESELSVAQGFLAFMTKRGFVLEDALHILHNAGRIAFGAAVETCRERAMNRLGMTMQQAVHKVLMHAAPEALALIRQAEQFYGKSHAVPALETLQPLIEQLARKRGETLPEPSSFRVPHHRPA